MSINNSSLIDSCNIFQRTHRGRAAAMAEALRRTGNCDVSCLFEWNITLVGDYTFLSFKTHNSVLYLVINRLQ